jgi:hypothetical protein
MLRPYVIILIILALFVGSTDSSSHARTGAGLSGAQTLTPAPPAPRRRALLVGVSGYCRDASGAQCNEHGKQWWNLNTGNDVDAIGEVLMSDRFGFKPEEIRTLKSKEETTHNAIVKAFRSFLVEQTRPGDIVYFHYSGHGSQVADDRAHGLNPKPGDELDGMDETLVPSDYAGLRDGSRDIRDDEMEQLLAELAGRHVTVTVDSCHSGTITRGGLSLVRGMRLSRPVPPNPRGAQDGPSGLFALNAALPRSLVVISAARNDQLAVETWDNKSGKQMGAFTSALLGAFRGAVPETTYRDLFERINAEVTGKTGDQDPQLEGSRDNLLFSGIARPPQPYINITVDTTRRVLLKAGSLQGMSAGSRFNVYAPGKDSKTGSPLAQAEIKAVGPIASVLKLTPEPDEKALEGLRAARAVETFHNFGDVRLKVIFEDAARSALGVEGLSELKALSLLNIAERAEDWNVRVCRGACPNERPVPGVEKTAAAARVLTLMREDGSVIERVPEDTQLTDAVRRVLEGEARWRFVKALNNESDPNLRLRMRLVPVTGVVQNPATGRAERATDLAPEVQPAEGNRIVLHDGDTVMLEVLNLGTTEVFVSVLDLRSNGGIGPLFPHPEINTGQNENRIGVKNDLLGNPLWQRVPFPFVIRIDPPYGREVFKAFITKSAADFSPLFLPADARELQTGRTRGTNRGLEEAQSPLGQLLLTATTGRTRGQPRAGARGATAQHGAEDIAHVSAPAADWATTELTFEARPPRKVAASAGQTPK